MLGERARRRWAPSGRRSVCFALSATNLPATTVLEARGRAPQRHPVVPEREGRGSGGRWLSAAGEVARASGAVSVWLLTAETNRRARTLFSSGGFQPVLRLPRAYVRGQAGVTMFKLLDA